MSEECDILVFMNAPSPYWVNFAQYLSQFYKINFIFYSTCSALGRPAYWDVGLPENCEVIEDGVSRWRGYFYDHLITKRIKALKPKVVVSQGINLVSALRAVKFCNRNNIHFSIWNEIWRNKIGLRRNRLSKLYAYIFRNADSRFSSSEEGVDFWAEKYRATTKLYYVSGNVDKYLSHAKDLNAECLNLLFGHRLIEQYNPAGAIEIASIINKSFPVRLFMNASGNLRDQLNSLIIDRKITFVEFIEVQKFSDLEDYYRKAHVSISPCYYSQGNIGTNEALASGCPIFISDKVKYHDLQIQASDVGFVLPLDYKLFAKKVVDDKALYSELSLNSKALAQITLSNSACLKYYDEIFSDMGIHRRRKGELLR
jgi:glycosyltransferase involved in cell wall biosynthesis